MFIGTTIKLVTDNVEPTTLDLKYVAKLFGLKHISERNGMMLIYIYMSDHLTYIYQHHAIYFQP